MSKSSPLFQLQKWIRWIVTDPRGVDAALKNKASPMEQNHPDRYLEPLPRKLSSIQVPTDRSQITQLSVYAEAFYIRILGALKSAYPKSYEAIGESKFRQLAAEYIKEHPSKTANLNEYGNHLAAFTSELMLSDEFPFLVDLMEVEWRKHLSHWNFHPQTSELVTALTNLNFQSILASTAPDSIYFNLNPSIILKKSTWSLDSEKVEKLEQEAHFIGYQQNYDFHFKQIEAAQYAMLEQLQRNENLLDTIANASESHPDFFTPENISSTFSFWTQNNLISLRT